MNTSKNKVISSKKFVILGCGAVGKCVLHYLTEFIPCEYKNIYVIEKRNEEREFPTVQQAIQKGVHFINFEILDNNLDELFLNILNVCQYDVIIDLTTRTNTFEIFKKVRQYSLLYINTSIEDNRRKDNYVDKSIFSQHINLMNINQKLSNNKKTQTTTLIEYGMNPGLISTFVRYGLKKLSREVLEYQSTQLKASAFLQGRENNCINSELNEAYLNNQYNLLAKILGVKVIHCSEIDTQIPNENTLKRVENNPNYFVNTWSVLGLVDEGCDPLEITLGTHENLPKIIEKFSSSNEINLEKELEYSNYYEQLLLINKPCSSIKINSVVPLSNTEFTQIKGRCIHHGESISLNRFLSDVSYSPTIHYVYQLNPITSNYLDTHKVDELLDVSRTNDWSVMNMYENELNGNDNVGALFILDKNPMTLEKETFLYWTGSILSTEYTKNVLGDKFFGPTIIQVMSGVLSGVSYIIQNENSEMGLIFGESIPEDFVIPKIEKYLGNFYSGRILLDKNEKLSTKFHELLV